MVKIKLGLGPAATTPTADPAQQPSLVRFIASCSRVTLRGGIIKGDKIVLRGLELHGYHGVKPEERESGQTLLIDVDAWKDLEAAGIFDVYQIPFATLLYIEMQMEQLLDSKNLTHQKHRDYTDR